MSVIKNETNMSLTYVKNNEHTVSLLTNY